MKKDEKLPYKRAPHAYMHDRLLDAPDTVSLVYPRHNTYGGDTVFYASLSSSVHKLNGTRKRAKMQRDEMRSQRS